MFHKFEGNPIFGDADTGTLFDVYLTKESNKTIRMNLSTRKNDALSVSFSEDGIKWTDPIITLWPNPLSGWEDSVNRNCVLKIGETYQMWYTGQAKGKSYIGFAQSHDGIRFARCGRAGPFPRSTL